MAIERVAAHRALLLFFCCLSCASCVVNPLPFGPGRVEVSLTKASIAATSPAQRIRYPLQDPAYFPRETLPLAIQFELASDSDLAWYFVEDWNRPIVVRCVVVGAETGREYIGIHSGPYYGPMDTSEARKYREFGIEPYFGFLDLSKARRHSRQELRLPPQPDGKFRYNVYAFFDLKARDREDGVGGKSAPDLDLVNQRFESLDCHLIGPAYVPLPILSPRTNTFSMTYAEFVKEMKAVNRAN